jgi:hypothetical protein
MVWTKVGFATRQRAVTLGEDASANVPAPTVTPALTWAERLQNGAAERLFQAARAETFVKRRYSASQPIDLKCGDGNLYVVKALRSDIRQGRMMFNDQIVARLGRLIGAPVADVGLIDIPKQLIDLNPERNTQMGHVIPCIAHGSRCFENVSERVDAFSHVSDDDNKSRFAAAGVLQAWVVASDRQFIYETVDPFRVYSVDHGHYFPHGPDWTTAHLTNAAPAAVAADLKNACALSQSDIAEVCVKLNTVSETDIGTILAIPPDTWDVPLPDRIALAEFLWMRRNELIKAYV